MKLLIAVISIALFFSLLSCSSSNIGHQYDYMEPNTAINNNTGFLKIYTVKYEEKKNYSDDASYEVFKGYSIYSKNGDFIKDVEKSYQTPKQVRLEEGGYVIIAELYKNVIQSFIISIEKELLNYLILCPHLIIYESIEILFRSVLNYSIWSKV